MPRRNAALDRAAAAGTRSGGHPPAGRREHRVRFWEAIARGASSVDAAAEAGVLPSIGVRWFRKGGGMPPLSLAPVSGRYLSFAEREEIGVLLARGCGVREIARQLGRAPSTISRELQRNSALRTGRPEYRASTAQTHADRRARRPKPAKLAVNPALRRYVQDRLAGAVQRPDGSVAGPQISWAGRRRGPRKDRRWGPSWSPEQISCRLRVDFPDDESMRVSHEAIYQSLYVQGRGALRRELTACLRTGRALRVPRNRTSRGNRSFVTDELLISERPAEVDDRAVPGHWEGDLILGTDRSAIGTLVERSSRFTMLLHLPPIEGHDSPTTNSSPARTGAGAAAVRDAIADTITTLPEQLRRSLTWDQGIEMAQHVQLRLDTGLRIYFCDPRSPWQRGTNENTNGLLRQYFPRGTNLARHSADELAAVAAALNGRPRKTLGWKTPGEVLTEYLSAAA
jgi:IS30 family transposase